MPDAPEMEYEEDVEEEEVQEEQQEEEVQDEQPQEEKEFVNAGGYIRILNKRLDEQTRQNEILAERLGRLLEKEERTGVLPEEAPVGVDEDDYASDPVGTIYKMVKELKKQLDAGQRASGEREQLTVAQQAIAFANQQIAGVAEEKGDEFTDAVAHLADVIRANIDDSEPNKTEREKLALIEQNINGLKLDWVSKGKNPGEEIMRKARLLGWKYQPERQQQPARQVPKPDAKAQIAAEKKKSGNGTIANMQFSSPQGKVTARALAAKDEKEFDRLIDDQLKSGKMRRGSGRTPSFSELLAGKGVEVG